MKRLLLSVLAMITALALVPGIAAAQHMGNAKHEFGVDLGLVYSKPSGGDGVFQIGTPVDVRIGFVSSGKLEVEPRFTFTYASGGGDNAYVFTPDINLLFGLGAEGNKQGPYVTFGAGVDLTHVSISGVSSSTSQFNFNGGIGTRVPYESGAIRLEAFVRYLLKNTSKNLPNTLDIGARIGLSLWH
jgi:outer membrane protein with beta-barrel domain